MAGHANRAALDAGDEAEPPVVTHALGRRVEDALDQSARDGDLGHDLAPTGVHEAQRRRLLVARQVGLDEPLSRRDRRARDDVLADRVGAERHHVLPRGIAGVEGEHQVHRAILHVDEQVEELAVARACRRDLPEALELAARPCRKVTGFGDRFEYEAGRALHLLDGREARCAAGLGDEARSAMVARHQRPLGGGERHVEVPVRVEAVHAQRADHAGGDLGHANELLDVAAEVDGVDLG